MSKFTKYSPWFIILLYVLAIFFLQGCRSNYNKFPTGETVSIRPQESRLIFSMPELKKTQAQVQRFTSKTGNYVEEFCEWRGLYKNDIAGILLSQSAKGVPLTDPQDPKNTTNQWSVFRDQKPSFGELRKSNNVLGPIVWRRSGIGTRSCVVFLQRWSLKMEKKSSSPITNLSGYYCKRSGKVFTPSFAEQVIKSIGLVIERGPKRLKID